MLRRGEIRSNSHMHHDDFPLLGAKRSRITRIMTLRASFAPELCPALLSVRRHRCRFLSFVIAAWRACLTYRGTSAN
jgi:hypothetical protein